MTSTARSRIGNLEPVPSYANSDKSRITNNTTFGKGIGNGGNSWNGGIWASTAIGSGIKNTSTDRILDEKTSRVDSVGAVTGSKSLLSSSESDSWSDRQSLPWASLENARPSLANIHTSHSSASSMPRQNSNQQSTRQPFAETSSNTSPNFSVNPLAALGQAFTTKASHKQFLDPNSDSFVVPGVFDSCGGGRSSRHNSDEENRRAVQPVVFGASELYSDHQSAYTNISGYNSRAVSRSGSLPPSRNSAHKSVSGDISANPQYSQYGHISTSRLQHRPNLSAQASAHSSRAAQQRFSDRTPLTHLENMDANLGRLRIGDHGQQTFTDQGSVPYEHDYETDPNDRDGFYLAGHMQQQCPYDPYSPDGSVAGSQPQQWNQYRNIPSNAQQAHSQGSNHHRRNQVGSNFSATRIPQIGAQNRTPSHTRNMPDGQAVLLDQKLRILQHQEQEFLLQQQRQQMQYQQNHPLPPYDYNPDGVQLNTMNPTYCSIPSQYMSHTPPQAPKATAKELDPAQPLRSALLDEFRSNNKTNKRYELKDIYNHIVEFSGDQHGSRFIQQKLETANSDEKDQVFREIHPNSIQLMTDVFGNYVIQKFFEHGNQSQKKILANSMKGHILTLSLQMYGCRVVQKALEHILTDQQASLISELANHVLRCVKDQNGNHVIQKAIERVPPIHIQFIINAFTGQVHALATHSFGCRVIQRMLEHCEEPTKTAVLQELHACTSLLITDQYGNYVTQHVIEHGSSEDRERIIALVKAQLVHCSKHKFASNVVEKSIQFGSPEQRREIVALLTPLNEKGESPLAGVIRDQFGNYVVQKLLTTLKGAEYDDFVEKVKVQLNLLKRFTCGKQITAIEKIVYTGPSMMLHQARVNSSPPPPIDTSAAPTPPLLTTDAQSPQSSSHPSTNASTADGPVGTRKASNSAPVEVGARSGGFDTELD